MSETNSLVPTYSIVDESLLTLSLDNCDLFIQIDSVTIALALRVVKSSRFVAFKVYNYCTSEDQIALFQADEFLSFKGFQKTIVAVVNIKSTLIPIALFDDENKVEFLSFNHDIGKNESVAKDDFRFFDAKNIFAIDDGTLAVLESNFSQPFIHHSSTAFIERMLLKNKNKKEIVVNANLYTQQLELAVVKDNQLLFYNSFNCQSAEDFVYYIMFVYEQLTLNPEQVLLELSGNLTANSAYLTISKKYIRFVQLAARNDANAYSYGFENLPSHQYQTLFDLGLCV